MGLREKSMKLLVSVLLGFATAVYNGDGVCKRPLFGAKESCQGPNRDDGCCTNEEKCSLYGDRDDFWKHFPTVTCSKISSSSTASPMTTKNIQITTAQSAVKTTSTVTMSTKDNSPQQCETCSKISQDFNGATWTTCMEKKFTGCPFEITKCNIGGQVTKAKELLDLMCFSGQKIEIESAFFGPKENSACCSGDQCGTCDPRDVTQLLFSSCHGKSECAFATHVIQDNVAVPVTCAGAASNALTVKFRCVDKVAETTVVPTTGKFFTTVPSTTSPKNFTADDKMDLETTTSITSSNNTTTVQPSSVTVTTVTNDSTTTLRTKTPTRLPDIVDTPKTPIIEGYFEDLIENLRKHCGETRINNNYSPTTNNNQNFIDIFADVHTDVNFSIVNLGDAKFANKKAMELLAKKVGASKHVIEKGVQVMEENMARAINEFLLESMQEDAL